MAGSRRRKPHGGQTGNLNAAKHGLSARRLPPGCKRLEGHLRKLQGDLEAAIVDRLGEVGIYQAALIQSAVRHEKTCSLMWRWLRLEGANMDVDQRVSLLTAAGKATDKRDACLKALGLDRREDPDLWGSLDTPPPAESAPPALTEKPAAPVIFDSSPEPVPATVDAAAS